MESKKQKNRPRIVVAKTNAAILRCFPVMKQLRPHLAEAEFVARVRRQNQIGGYELAFVAQGEGVRCVAGFRLSQSFYYGRFLYVDDLVTDEAARGQGYGSMLFDWLVRHAKDNGCEHLALDSGVQRFGAHRFYLAKRMNIVCHHFALKLA